MRQFLPHSAQPLEVIFLFSCYVFTMFYSVCGDKFPEPPICVNVFLNKFSASFVAPFRIFDRSRRAAWIPDGFASFLRIVMRQTTSHRPGLPGVERPTEARALCRSALC